MSIKKVRIGIILIFISLFLLFSITIVFPENMDNTEVYELNESRQLPLLNSNELNANMINNNIQQLILMINDLYYLIISLIVLVIIMLILFIVTWRKIDKVSKSITETKIPAYNRKRKT